MTQRSPSQLKLTGRARFFDPEDGQFGLSYSFFLRPYIQLRGVPGLNGGIDVVHSPGTTAVHFQVGNAWFRP